MSELWIKPGARVSQDGGLPGRLQPGWKARIREDTKTGTELVETRGHSCTGFSWAQNLKTRRVPAATETLPKSEAAFLCPTCVCSSELRAPCPKEVYPQNTL